MRNEKQAQLIARLRGYADELPNAGKTRRRRIARELRADARAYSDFSRPLLAIANHIMPWAGDGRKGRSWVLGNVDAATAVYQLNQWALQAEALWPEEVRMARLSWPVEGGPDAHPITRTAAEHEAFGQQPALDFGDPDILGAFTVANFPGTVRFAGLAGDAGWMVEVEGDVNGDHLVAGWCHHGTPDYGGLWVETGDDVDAGQRLGPCGYSGWVIPAGEAGAHLHWKLTVDGSRVDPESWLSVNPAPDSVDA